MTIVFDEVYLKHRQSHMHPERPERLEEIVGKMKAEGLWDDVVKPSSAEVEDVLLNHSKRYLERVRDSREGYLDPDTYLRSETYDIAMRAVGGGIEAARRAWDGKKTTLALLRPPGHHAVESSSMGFCYFNNVAIAARKLRDKAERIAIIDPDVHHGNGTQDSFYDTDEVLYISSHQQYIFPGTGHVHETGSGTGKGYTVNIPFDNGCGDVSYELAYSKVVRKVLEQYEPDMIMVSLGTDAHYEDMLAGLRLSSGGYLDVIRGLHGLAGELCDGRFSVFLEGGYALEPLAEIVTATYGLGRGKEVELEYTDVYDTGGRGKGTVKDVLDAQRKYWKL